MTQYVGLDDYFAIAAEQLGLDTLTVLRLSRVDLADSALNAPRAEFASVEFYPTLPGEGRGAAVAPGAQPPAPRR